MTTREETTHPHILAEGTVDCPTCGTQWEFLAMARADGARALCEATISKLTCAPSEAKLILGVGQFEMSPLRVQVFRPKSTGLSDEKQCPNSCDAGAEIYHLVFMVLDGRLGPGALKENGGPVYLRQNRVTAVQGEDCRLLAW